MDFSRLDRNRVLLGGIGSIVLIVSTLFLPWYSLTHLVGSTRTEQNAWICGANDYSCTGFDTFPIMRWLVLAGALAPLILGWILIRGHKLSWAPGELTMVVGFILIVLIGYNGLIDKPGSGPQEIGVSLDYGYWLALVGSIAIAATGFLRSQVGQKQQRKAPGTV
jgi:sorbitol-specific phosphotransferase system component IIC